MFWIIRIKKNNGNKELSTSGFLGVTCISWSRVYTAPLRPTVLVRPLKFPFILVQDLCYRSLKVFVIGIHIAKT
jgi:hypothetical protein